MEMALVEDVTGRVLKIGPVEIFEGLDAGTSLIPWDGDETLKSKVVVLAGSVFEEDPAFLQSQAWASLRSERDARLSATDKFVLPDYPISEELLTAVKNYRTALRNLPEATVDPLNPEWPVSPV